MNDMCANVAVLMGGFSQEREVSLNSGSAVARGLRAAGHQVTEIDVVNEAFTRPRGTDVVFIALHGIYGEDGGVQARLEKMGVPYTGSDQAASRLAFDKALAKQTLIQAGIMTPVFEILRQPEARTLPLPVVVKPVRQGSSFGVHHVTSDAEWQAAFNDAAAYDDEVLVENYINGRELTVGIVGNEILPVIEIRAPNNNYDYHAKYTKGATAYLVPAPLEADLTHHCQTLSQRTFQALGARGFGRVDLRLSDDGILYVLELNTIPGFTETSLLPKAAVAAGIPFADLCDRILKLAQEGSD